MAKYSGKTVTIAKPASAVVDRFSDLSKLQPVIDNLPEEQRSKVSDISLTNDSICLNTQQVGKITFTITERTEQRVAFNAVGAPVPMGLVLDIKPTGAEECQLTTSIDVDIPIFMRAMVGGALQKAADQFGEVMQKLI